jgi:hypothetical protein
MDIPLYKMQNMCEYVAINYKVHVSILHASLAPAIAATVLRGSAARRAGAAGPGHRRGRRVADG